MRENFSFMAKSFHVMVSTNRSTMPTMDNGEEYHCARWRLVTDRTGV